MTQVFILDMMRSALMTVLAVAGPILAIALTVGLTISILQATTQIQEQTLTFVPKLIAVMVSLLSLGSFIMNKLVSFTENIFELINNII